MARAALPSVQKARRLLAAAKRLPLTAPAVGPGNRSLHAGDRRSC